MKNKFILLSVLIVFLVPVSFVHGYNGSEVTITKDGAVSVTNVKVMQIFGSTFATRLYWDDAFIRLTVKTNNKTNFFRGTGESTTLSEIAEGDTLDITGVIDPGSALTIMAYTIRNSSVQKKQTVLSGKVVSVDLSSRKFGLETKKYGIINVTATSTTKFLKGSRLLDLEHIKIGDTIDQASGDYDLNTKNLVAKVVTIFVDLNYYKPKNFTGKFQEVSDNSVKVLVGGVLYTVNTTDKTTILNKSKTATLLSRFVSGDSVILYGAIREVDEPIIDAEVIRNINL